MRWIRAIRGIREKNRCELVSRCFDHPDHQEIRVHPRPEMAFREAHLASRRTRYHVGVTTIRDDALVLDHHPFKDRHLIVAVLTATHGEVRGVLRSARGGRVPLAGAVQILSKVEVELFRKPSAELATFTRIDLLQSSFPLAGDLEQSSAAAVVAELLSTYCPPDEPAPRRFRLGCAALDGLLAGIDPDRVVAYVQYWVLRLGGLMPDLEALDGDPSADELAFLIACRRIPLAELELPVPGGVRSRLDRLVREHAERNLKALDFHRQHGAAG